MLTNSNDDSAPKEAPVEKKKRKKSHKGGASEQSLRNLWMGHHPIATFPWLSVVLSPRKFFAHLKTDPPCNCLGVWLWAETPKVLSFVLMLLTGFTVGQAVTRDGNPWIPVLLAVLAATMMLLGRFASFTYAYEDLNVSRDRARGDIAGFLDSIGIDPDGPPTIVGLDKLPPELQEQLKKQLKGKKYPPGTILSAEMIGKIEMPASENEIDRVIRESQELYAKEQLNKKKGDLPS